MVKALSQGLVKDQMLHSAYGYANGQQKGSRSYTNKFEEELMGMIHKLYWYAEKIIGNQAFYTDLANCMKEKAMVNPELQQTKFNMCNVWR